MPSTVVVAAVITGLYVAFAVRNLFDTPRQGKTGQAIVSILILIGMVRGHALAWQWGRLTPFVAAIAGGLVLVMRLTDTSNAISLGMLVMLCFLVAGSGALTILLSFKSSKRYFGLSCPHCGSLRSKADNFFYSAYRCRDCGSTWR